MTENYLNIEKLLKENESLKKQLSVLKTSKISDLYNNVGIAIGEFDIENLRSNFESFKSTNQPLSNYLSDSSSFKSILFSIKPNKFNQEAVNLFESGNEETLVDNFYLSFIDETIDDFKKAFENFYQKHPLYEGETVFKTLKGNIINVIYRINFQNTNPDEIVVSFIDISERINLENKLKTSEESYRTLFNNVPVMIWEEDLSELREYFLSLKVDNSDHLRRLLLDENSSILVTAMKKFKVVNVNSTTVKVLKAPNRSDLINNFVKYFPKNGLLMFINNLIHIYNGELKFQHESQLLTTENELLDVFVTWEVDSNHTKDFSKVLVIMIDITKQKEIEKDQKRFNDQLQQFQKLDSLGLLAGGIAHDFNNLLVPILGNIGLAQTYTQEDTLLYQHLQQIEETIFRASDLTKQLLTYSGKGKFTVEVCNLNEIIKNLDYLIRLTATKTVRLTYDLAKSLPNIEADITQIQQIILNLISNAAASMHNKGNITIKSSSSVYTKTDLETEFSKYALPPGTYIILEVMDEGEGIPDFIKDNIFDPFFSTKSGVKGLGLSVVHGIVVTHKGGITFSSKEGEGTVFKVIFPKTEQNLIQTSQAAKEKTKHTKKTNGTVLVCDDEQSVREITSLMLTKMDLLVIEASDGKESLEILKTRNDISLVILDLTMPGLDGEKTSREIRKINSKIPILIVSGYNRLEIDLRFTGLDSINFLQKPYSYQILKDKIQKLLE